MRVIVALGQSGVSNFALANQQSLILPSMLESQLQLSNPANFKGITELIYNVSTFLTLHEEMFGLTTRVSNGSLFKRSSYLVCYYLPQVNLAVSISSP